MTIREPPPLIGESPAMDRVRDLITRFAPTALPILIVGPTGAGKDLMAQHVHCASGRRGPWVPVNCGVLPREMADSLLFGHRRGSFSGAVESRSGHLERAGGGTLFLDEVFTLAEEIQVKLLRSLEDGDIQPLGEDRPRHIDLRIVAAMQEDAADRLETGRFRRDLFRRLAGVVITAPSLAERPEDILPLARHFAGLQGRLLESGAERAVVEHSWPDNVRELRQAIERAGYLVTNGTLSGAAIVEAIRLGTPQQGVYTGSAQLVIDLSSACAEHGWNASRIARFLGISRSTLFERLRVAGLSLRLLRQAAKSKKSTESNGPSQTIDAAEGRAAP